MAIFFPKRTPREERSRWEPQADIYRTERGWVVKFDLAGVRPEDVTIQASGSNIHIKGTRRDWIIDRGWHHYSMEISYDRFERVLELPCDLSGAEIKAECRGGMLLLHVVCS